MATAQTLLHRFYYRKSLRQFDALRVAMSCLFLSAKVEETPKRVHDVVHVFYATFRRRKWKRAAVTQQLIDVDSATFSQWRSWLLIVERQVLIDLGFSIYNVTEHPHKYVLYYVKVLDGSSELAQQAWGYINDSLRRDICVRYKAQVTACAAIFLASRFQRVVLPEHPPWYSLFDVEKAELYAVSVAIMELYKQEKVEWLEPLTETNPFAMDDYPMEKDVPSPELEKLEAKKEKEKRTLTVTQASADAPALATHKSPRATKVSSVRARRRRSRWDDGLANTRRSRSRSLRRSRSKSDGRKREGARSSCNYYRRKRRHSRLSDCSNSRQRRRRRSSSYSRSRSRSSGRSRRR
uniref:Cyclin-like domain-containing protein n=1 Tax=Hyaloperonospora arabidopsidis (strain Emoy2) TaxID=559515 RepID=M4BAF8_HYAAE